MQPPSNREILRYEPPRGLRLALIVIGGLLALAVAAGILGRVNASQERKQTIADNAVPTVELVAVKADTAARDVVLPADVQPFNNATVYARVSGYLKSWGPDIGAQVRRGQLLAVVDTPDLDQQLVRLRADLNTALASQALSRSTEARWKGLLAADAVSKQEYDEKAADLAVKTSLVAAARANLAQLEATAGFKRVVAPFDGVVTQRATDIGSLVSAGNAGAPLYTIADARRLRIYVRVPQIRPGMAARLLAPERPNDVFVAHVINDAQAISAQSGTMLVQLQINNADGRLKPGQYVQAQFALPAAVDTVTLPATALMYRAAGPQVALVDAQGKVHLRTVVIGKDFGSKVQIASGLSARQQVVDNPPDALLEGDAVKVVAAAKKAPAGG